MIPTNKPMTVEKDVMIKIPHVAEFGAFMAFSLRTGGCSPAPFDSLNFSSAHGDSTENILKNFQALGNALSVDPIGIATCEQVHGDDILFLETSGHHPGEYDAIISADSDFFPAVKTADCLPILIVDKERRVSAAVHSGWRGTVRRIAGKVARSLQERFGCKGGDLFAALGPAIGRCCYEVDDAVLVPFHRSYPEAAAFTESSSRNGKPTTRLDLRAANMCDLMSAGIPAGNISNVDLCTCCTPDLFFSYRRNGPLSGRHIAVAGFHH
jgi:polyphenol oxidase